MSNANNIRSNKVAKARLVVGGPCIYPFNLVLQGLHPFEAF